MTDLREKKDCPTIEEIGMYVKNPVFLQFCSEIRETFKCKEKIEYSSCSLERGWNVKFRKAGRSLCTVYPREGYFTVLVVVGTREKGHVEKILPDCEPRLQEIYHQTKEGNGQRWLMIDVEDEEEIYGDVLRLIRIRRDS